MICLLAWGYKENVMAENIYMKRKGKRAAAAMIMRNQYSQQFGIQYYLIVEGESDEHFFENIIDYRKCKVINLEGKDNVKQFIIDRNRRGEKGFLGIVDADFEHITKYEPQVDNILITDFHDMEMLMLSSKPNMRRIYSELSENLLIDNYEKNNQRDFLSSVLEACYEIGLLKLIMCRPKYRVNMDNIPYELVDDLFNVNMDELIKRSIHQHHSLYEVKTEIETEKVKKHDIYQVCCGHDVTEILCRCFISYENGGLGYGKNERLNKGRIESLLRVIYEFKHFMTTQLYSSILDWEQKNEIDILDKSICIVA